VTVRKISGGLLPRETLVATGAIGSIKALLIWHSYGTSGCIGLRSWKILALSGALVLAVLVLAFADREAQAQQQHAVIAAQVADQTATTPVEASPAGETLSQEEPPAETSPLVTDGATTSSAPEPQGASGPGYRLKHGFKQAIVPGDQYAPAAPVGSRLAPPALSSVSDPVSGPVSTMRLPGNDPTPQPDSGTNPVPPPVDPEPESGPVGPVTEPVATEETLPLSSLPQEAPAAEPIVPSPEEEVYPPRSVSSDPMIGAVEDPEENVESVDAGALGSRAAAAPSRVVESAGAIDAELASLFSGGGIERTPDSDPIQEEPVFPPTGSETPLKDAPPQPVSPFTPPVGSSFSLSGGQIGSGGGAILLLLCALTAGLILLRRDYELLWTFHEHPKPNSALHPPLERPG
jgi:hypothetical protein